MGVELRFVEVDQESELLSFSERVGMIGSAMMTYKGGMPCIPSDPR